MSLVGDPDLLVVEEPTAGLDASGVLRLRSVLREAATSVVTVVLLARRERERLRSGPLRGRVGERDSRRRLRPERG
jgi:ABC-type molybdenum transport system ATPase subunit/photorepair protein PhrA